MSRTKKLSEGDTYGIKDGPLEARITRLKQTKGDGAPKKDRTRHLGGRIPFPCPGET